MSFFSVFIEEEEKTLWKSRWEHLIISLKHKWWKHSRPYCLTAIECYRCRFLQGWGMKNKICDVLYLPERKIYWSKTWRIWILCTCTICLLNAGFLLKTFSAGHRIPWFPTDALCCDINVSICRNLPFELFWGVWQISILLYLMKVMSQQLPRTFLHKFCLCKLTLWCVFDFCNGGWD